MPEIHLVENELDTLCNILDWVLKVQKEGTVNLSDQEIYIISYIQSIKKVHDEKKRFKYKSPVTDNELNEFVRQYEPNDETDRSTNQ